MKTMKNNYFLYLMLFILSGSLFMACEPDPVNVEDPQISLSTEAGYIYKDTTLQRGEIFKVKVTAAAGTNNLKLMQINENDVKMALDRIISGLNSNPALTLNADAQGFTKEIEIQAQADGLSKYTFYVEDEGGYTNGASFVVTDVYSGLDTVASGLKVYNFSGPLDGSIDLQVPKVVPSSDPKGDIQDEGINLNLPAATNWLQQIRPKNGAKLYKPAEGLAYDAIDSKEKLKAAVEAGTEVIRSQALKIGDIYLAKTASLQGTTMDYFLLRVDNIVIEADNNNDYYLFTLKQALNM